MPSLLYKSFFYNCNHLSDVILYTYTIYSYIYTIHIIQYTWVRNHTAGSPAVGVGTGDGPLNGEDRRVGPEIRPIGTKNSLEMSLEIGPVDTKSA